jgi:CRP/FNR family transcriptional regulator
LNNSLAFEHVVRDVFWYIANTNFSLPMRALEIPEELFNRDSAQFKQIQLNAGYIVCDINSYCPNLLVVEKGCLRVFMRSSDGRTFTLYRVNPGECCCLTVSSIMNDTRFPAAIEVEEEGTALVISAGYVRKCISKNVLWQAYLFQLLTRNISHLTDLTDILAFNSMDSRVANLLCQSGVNKAVIRATHQCLANEVGTSREVISRSLGHLEEKGFIKLSRGQVEILDQQGLESFTSIH